MSLAAIWRTGMGKYWICSSVTRFVYGATQYSWQPDLLCDRLMAGIGAAIVSPTCMPLAIALSIRRAEAESKGIDICPDTFTGMRDMYLGQKEQGQKKEKQSDAD